MQFREGIFESLPELVGKRVKLRALRMKDAEDLYAVCCDPAVARYVMWDTHKNIGETRAFLRSILRNYRADRPSPWGIALVEDDRVIGTMGYSWINRDHNCAEIGYSLGQRHWNQGYASEALALLLRYSFECLYLHRVEAQHDVRNPASGRVMEKAGMRREGMLRDRLYCKGEHITVDLYAAIEPDHRAAARAQRK